MSALPSNVNWDVQPGTGNDATNGGGFVPGASGTDYSKQASPQYTLTGCTSSGAGNVVLTASAAADMVGNIAQCISGTNFTTGFFEVVSVSVGVSITFSTNNAGTAITTGVGASGDINIGGTLNTISKAVGAAIAGNIVYFKGTYTVSAALTFGTPVQNNDFATPFTIAGYTTTHGDGGKATWTTATNSINLIDVSSLYNAQFLNIIFTNTAGTVGAGIHGNAIIPVTVNAENILVSNCSMSGFNVGVSADWQNISFAIVNLQLDNCEIKTCASHGVQVTGSMSAFGCWFHGNTGDGVRISTSINNSAYNYTSAFSFCVFYSNGGNGITNTANQNTGTLGGVTMLTFDCCDFVSNTGDGINSPGSHSGATRLVDCIIYGNGGWGYNSPTSNALVNAIPRNNAYGSNTSGARQNFPTGPNDIALSASPFTNPSGGDFSLNATSGGGAACKGAGFGTFSFGTGHIDIGAVQSAGGGGGGGGLLVNPGMTGGCSG